MTCQGLPTEYYGFYALGSLTGAELAELQDHLNADCTRCRQELRLARGIWQGVALSAPDAVPSRALARRVAGSVQVAEPHGFRLAWWQPVAGLATLALACFGGWQMARITATPANVTLPVPVVQIAPVAAVGGESLASLERENQLLKQKVAALAIVPSVPPKSDDQAALLRQQQETLAATQQELVRQKELLAASERNAAEADKKYTAALAALPKAAASEDPRILAAAQARTQQLERDLAQYKSLLASARQKLEAPVQASILADPNLKVVRLRGTASGSDIEGHVLLSSGSQVLFYGSRLPALPAGRAYQLWLIRGSAPAIVSAGVFQPNAQRRATVRFDSATLTSGVTAIAVTDEPEAGSLTPTGHKLLIGS